MDSLLGCSGHRVELNLSGGSAPKSTSRITVGPREAVDSKRMRLTVSDGLEASPFSGQLPSVGEIPRKTQVEQKRLDSLKRKHEELTTLVPSFEKRILSLVPSFENNLIFPDKLLHLGGRPKAEKDLIKNSRNAYMRQYDTIRTKILREITNLMWMHELIYSFALCSIFLEVSCVSCVFESYEIQEETYKKLGELNEELERYIEDYEKETTQKDKKTLNKRKNRIFNPKSRDTSVTTARATILEHVIKSVLTS